MAIEVAELIAHFTADTKKFVRDVTTAGEATKKTGAAAEGTGGKVATMGRVANKAALAGVAVLGIALEKSVHEAYKAQQSEAQLDAAFKASHLSAEKYKGQVEELEGKTRKLGFTDNDTREGLSKLLIATGSMKVASQDMGVAADYARLKHQSLASASETLAKAMGGSARAAKALGIIVPTVTTAEDKVKEAFKKHTGEAYKNALAHAKLIDAHAKAAKIIDLVRQKVHGQAQAYADTAAGGLAQMHAQTEHLEETLGKALIPALTVMAEKLADASTFLSEHTGLVKIALAVIGAFVALVYTVKLGMLAWSAATKVATAAQWLFNIALDANPIVIAIAAIVAIGIALYIFRDKVEAVAHVVVDKLQAAWNWISDNWPLLLAILTGPFGLAVYEVATHLDEIKGKITGAFDAFKNAATTLGTKIKDGVVDGVTGVANAAWNLIHDIADKIQNKLSDIMDWGRRVGSHVKSGVVDGLTGVAGAAWDLINNIIGIIHDKEYAIAGWGKDVGSAIFNGVKDGLSGLGEWVIGKVKDAINGVIRLFNKTADSFDFPYPKHVHWSTWHGVPTGFPHIDWGHLSLPDIPQLAVGGIATQQTLAMLGERGKKEAIIPLESSAGRRALGGLGGDTYVFNFPQYVGSKEEVARIVRDTLIQHKRRNVSLGLS